MLGLQLRLPDAASPMTYGPVRYPRLTKMQQTATHSFRLLKIAYALYALEQIEISEI